MAYFLFYLGWAGIILVTLFGDFKLEEITLCENGVKDLVFDSDEYKRLNLHYSFNKDQHSGRHSKLSNANHAFLCVITRKEFDCGLKDPIEVIGKWKLINKGYKSTPNWIAKKFGGISHQQKLLYGFTNNNIQIYGEYLYIGSILYEEGFKPGYGFKKELKSFRQVHCKNNK